MKEIEYNSLLKHLIELIDRNAQGNIKSIDRNVRLTDCFDGEIASMERYMFRLRDMFRSVCANEIRIKFLFGFAGCIDTTDNSFEIFFPFRVKIIRMWKEVDCAKWLQEEIREYLLVSCSPGRSCDIENVDSKAYCDTHLLTQFWLNSKWIPLQPP